MTISSCIEMEGDTWRESLQQMCCPFSRLTVNVLSFFWYSKISSLLKVLFFINYKLRQHFCSYWSENFHFERVFCLLTNSARRVEVRVAVQKWNQNKYLLLQPWRTSLRMTAFYANIKVTTRKTCTRFSVTSVALKLPFIVIEFYILFVQIRILFHKSLPMTC